MNELTVVVISAIIIMTNQITYYRFPTHITKKHLSAIIDQFRPTLSLPISELL
jgi:hypothetical protein